MKTKKISKIKKVQYSILLVFALCGCSSNGDTNNLADGDTFGYSADYNTLSNTKKTYSALVEIEDGIIVFPTKYEEDIVGMAYKKHNQNQFKMIESNPSENCSIDHLQNCSSSMNSSNISHYTYYNNYMYYVKKKSDEKTDLQYDVLMRMDLEGNDKKEVYQFDDIELNDYIFTFEFHQNYLYYCKGELGIQRVNLKDYKKDADFTIGEGEIISDMHFYDNSMYFSIENYTYNDQLYPDAIQCLDLNTKKIEFVTDKRAYMVDKDNMILVESEDDYYSTYFYNRRTNEENLLFNTPSLWVFRYKDYYVLDSVGITKDEVGNLYLISLDGEILDTIHDPYTGFKWGQGIVKDKYYVYDQGEQQFFYYEIKDNKFSKRHDLSYE